MIVPASSFTATLEVKKSKFIASAFYCDSFEALKAAIARTRAENPGARHVVHAAVIGTQFSMSDDKEPRNTAGRPALEVLKGSGITNIGLTITRYFGGILLGTGGLVKAYGDSAKAALAGIRTEEYTPRALVRITTGYELHQGVMRILESFDAMDASEDFGSEVIVKAKVPVACKEQLEQEFAGFSSGTIHIVWC